MIVYYSITIIINILLLITFKNDISISVMSFMPLFLLCLSIFQAVYFNNNRGKKDFNSNNASELTDEEWERLTLYMSRSYIIAIPMFIPFIFFFSSWLKMLSVLVFLAAFCGGGVYYRLRYSDELMSRILKEEKELEEQKKNEELGNWK